MIWYEMTYNQIDSPFSSRLETENETDSEEVNYIDEEEGEKWN